MKISLSIIFTIFIIIHHAFGQIESIYLENPSFEGNPLEGFLNGVMLEGWYDCSFPGETIPDVHPVKNSTFRVETPPADGHTYLGLVVRDNNTWERITQRLSSPLQAGTSYSFSIQLARSITYESPTRTNSQLQNWTTPCVLRIWGGHSACSRVELLGESDLVMNSSWKTSHFLLKPSKNYSHIVFEAFYQSTSTRPYNGNLLLDHASNFIQVDTVTAGMDTTTESDHVGRSFNHDIDSENKLNRFEFVEPHMGTDFKIVFYTDSKNVFPKEVAKRVFARIAEIDNICSDYKEDSELSILNSLAGLGEAISISDDLFNVLYASRQVSIKSKGSFNYTAGALTKLWRKAFRQKELPSQDDINAALRTIGDKHVILGNRQKCHINKKGTRLDFGGIAKGYAVDEALKVLKNYGITIALVDGGGDIAVGDPPPGESGWTIQRAVFEENGELTTEPITLANQAIATSGDTEKYLEVDGKRYSHIIDPRTGYGVTKREIVSVVAPTCTEADAWATALSVEVVTKAYLWMKKQGMEAYYSR